MSKNHEPAVGGGCYRCGSPEGNESRLCPRCTEARIKQRGFSDDRLDPRKSRDRELTIADFFESSFGRALITVFIGMMVAMHYLFSPWGPGLGLSAGEQAYRRCLKRSQKEQGAKFDQHVDYWSTMCAEKRSACDRNPDGAECASVISDLWKD